MILPLGGPMGMTEDEPPPSIIKEEYSTYWWALVAILSIVAVGRAVALDVFGGIVSVMVGFFAWYMVRDGCAKMTQYCLLMFGICCAMEAMFEFISLATSLAGRRTEHTTRAPVTDSKVSYTTVVETHAFFDPAMGWHYNFQSGMKIATFLSLILSACLSSVTYNLFPSRLFDEEAMGGGGAGGNGRLLGNSPGGGGGYQGFGSTSGGGRPLGGGGGGPVGGSGGRPPLFEGTGQRLGAN
uniref:Uncharacterized protein n=1 Tax=Alexandrium catenella TaxID=2925 RepID=A0A7S1WGM8_ALECA